MTRFAVLQSTSHHSISRQEELQKPLPIDIKETRKILKDFYITVSVPTFDTLLDLYKWRKNIINSKLN